MLKLGTPLRAAFIPLVPEASMGLWGVLSQRSTPAQSDRAKCPPWGLDGGGDASGNRVAFRLGGQWKDDFPNAKVLVAQLKPEDAFRISSGGGGGYGSPYERPADVVAEDVRQGYVSVKAARELYGVVVDAETFAVDQAATAQLRSASVRAAG